MSVPVRSFSWGVDSVHYVKFNPVEVRLGHRKGQDLSAVLAGRGRGAGVHYVKFNYVEVRSGQETVGTCLLF